MRLLRMIVIIIDIKWKTINHDNSSHLENPIAGGYLLFGKEAMLYVNESDVAACGGDDWLARRCAVFRLAKDGSIRCITASWAALGMELIRAGRAVVR